MDETGLGYKVDVNAVGIVDHVISKTTTGVQIKRQGGVAPVELIGSGFIRKTLAATGHARGHGPFITQVPWSEVTAVEDGDKCVLVCGIRKTVDVETGESWIGCLDGIDTNSSITQIGNKYMDAWH